MAHFRLHPYNPASPSPAAQGDATIPLSRDRLIENNIPLVEALAERFAWRMRLDAADREDWKQEAFKSLIRTVDLSRPGETQASLEIRIRRNVKSRLIELARPFHLAAAKPEPLAASLNPRPDSQYYIEEIGQVQLLMFAQCCQYFPNAAKRRLKLEIAPKNKEKLIALAKANMSSNWLNDLGKIGLKAHHIEPLILVHGLDLDQCEAARVLQKSGAAVSMLLAHAERSIRAAGGKNIFRTSLITGG